MLKPIPLSQLHEIIPPERDESCYWFKIQNKLTSKRAYAWLTYELFPDSTGERSLLLTDDSTLLTNLSEKEAYGTLSEALTSAKDERVGVAKTLVNDLVDGKVQMRNVRVVVHKFGPVPAVVAGEKFELIVHGRRVKCQIALFPRQIINESLPLGIRYTPCFISAKREFRRSMSIAPHIVFREYFEGVAEDFHDIRRTLKHTDFYRRAKFAETRLAQSVASKLHQLLPATNLQNATDTEQCEAWSFFHKNAEILYEAKIAYTYALFALNEVYRQMGVHYSDRYRNELSHVHRLFESLLGARDAASIRERSDVLQFFQKCQDRHEAEDLFHSEFHVADELLSHAENDSPNDWCKEFAKFSAFGIIHRRLVPRKGLVRVFISYHHQVPASEILRDQLAQFLRERYGNNIVAVFVSDLPPTMPFRHIIRSAIWLSQATIAICPTDTSNISETRDKNYKWIARESEYSVLLNKRLLFSTQDGASSEDIVRDMKNPEIGYLLSGSRVPSNEQRAKALVKHFVDGVRVQFQLNGLSRKSAHLDPRLQEELPRFLDDLSSRSLEMLLDGYVGQFLVHTQKTLIFLLRRMGYRGTHPRAWLEREISSYSKFPANKTLENFWTQTRNRRLDVGSRGSPLIDYAHGKYSERLSVIIRVLLPHLKSGERRAWRENWLNKWTKQLGL